MSAKIVEAVATSTLNYHQALHKLLLRAYEAMNGDSGDAESDALVALVDFCEEEHPDAAVTADELAQIEGEN